MHDTETALAQLLQSFAKRGELTGQLEAVDIEIAQHRGELQALRARDVVDAQRAKDQADKAAADAAAVAAAAAADASAQASAA